MFGQKDSNNKRFDVTYKENTIRGYKVIVDKQTGVNYLFTWDGYAGGLTVLLNADGTPIVTPVAEEY